MRGSWLEAFPDWDMPNIWNGNGLYDSPGRAIWSDPWRVGPVCGGEPPGALNAEYCRLNDTVSWDLALLETQRAAIGDDVVYVAIAHEIAHAAQNRLESAGQTDLIWPGQEEMQADCLAGAFVSRANGEGRIQVSGGGPDQMLALLAVVADAEPWSTYGDHGAAWQREIAFQEGVGGVQACLGPTSTWALLQPELNTTPKPAQGPYTRMSLITPSGNIWCADSGAHLQCTIEEYDFPASCGPGGMPMASLHTTGSPRADSCAGRLLDGLQQEPTSYGDDLRVGSFRCTVERTGLTCFNSDGHGFELSRAALSTF